jgi:hemerythrin-like domain-containing protein
MCNYCGCREFPLISRLTAEHEEIAETAGALARAVNADSDASVGLLHTLIGLLEPHITTEERGLFAELRAEPEFTATIESLCAEHEDIDGVLRGSARDGIDPVLVLPAVERLYRHIDKEEHGIFPAAVVLLDMSAWDRGTTNA